MPSHQIDSEILHQQIQLIYYIEAWQVVPLKFVECAMSPLNSKIQKEHLPSNSNCTHSLWECMQKGLSKKILNWLNAVEEFEKVLRSSSIRSALHIFGEMLLSELDSIDWQSFKVYNSLKKEKTCGHVKIDSFFYAVWFLILWVQQHYQKKEKGKHQERKSRYFGFFFFYPKVVIFFFFFNCSFFNNFINHLRPFLI